MWLVRPNSQPKSRVISRWTSLAPLALGPKAAKRNLSALDAAAKVLATAGEPMGCKELIEVMAVSRLIEIEHKGADQHDRAILTLAAGALGITVTFIEKIAPNPIRWTIGLLLTSWFFLVLSILGIVVSFLVSQAACRYQRTLLDLEYATGRRPDQKNRLADCTKRLNAVAFVFFVMGLAFILLFSGFNL